MAKRKERMSEDKKNIIVSFINVSFPNTEYQRCIVHQVRNTLKYVSEKDKKAFATNLKKI